MQKTKNQGRSFGRAFSLIELLVVIAIVGILSVVMIVSFNSGKSLKEVEGGALLAASAIREAQTAALAGKQYAGGTPCAYRVAWGGSQVTVSYLPKSGSSCASSGTTMSTVTMPPGVSFTSAGNADFTLPYAQIVSSQVLTLQKGSSSWVVCLRSNGNIEAEASSASC